MWYVLEDRGVDLKPARSEPSVATAAAKWRASSAGPTSWPLATRASSAAPIDSFGALHQMLAALPEGERDGVWSDIERALARFESSDGFAGPCELLVASGTK